MNPSRSSIMPQAAPPRLRGTLSCLLAWIVAATERSRQRRALAALSDSQLDDIGVSRRDVSRETAKRFWRM
jgi:uncharacterized protein YjiS (DUF1127 family)